MSNNVTSNQTISTTIEVLGKPYPIRCLESEYESLLQAADYINRKMREVQESGKAINLERIAIITALNIAHEFLQLDQQKDGLLSKINHRIVLLQNKLDTAINNTKQAELVYTAE
jgi:cell division protein ZapA